MSALAKPRYGKHSNYKPVIRCEYWGEGKLIRVFSEKNYSESDRFLVRS
jgi:hypothetical protein